MSRAIKIQLQTEIKVALDRQCKPKGDFAKELGISQTRLGVILNQNPSIEKLIELLDKLGYAVGVNITKRDN